MMARLLSLFAIVVLFMACAPFQPSEGDAAGVTLTFEGGAFELAADPPVRRALLRAPGENLTVDHEDCEIVEGAVECIFGTTSAEVVEVGGAVRLIGSDGEPLDVAVVCRDECHAISVSEPD